MIAFIFIFICFAVSSSRSMDNVFKNKMAGMKVVEANNRFALDLLRICSQNNTNPFFSPFSISVALAMVYGGAVGKTKREMKEAMHLTRVNDEFVHEAFSDIQTALPSRSVRLHLANKLFAEQSYKFLPEYFELSRKYYNADQQNVDFLYDYEGARKTINEWVEEKTDYMIKDIISEGVLDEDTKLVLVNAIYFKGDWEKKFDRKETKRRDFHMANERTVKIPFMFVTDNYYHGENKEIECYFLEIPYAGDQISLNIYLPFDTSNVVNLENRLTSGHLTDSHRAFGTTEKKVDLYLPRFRLDLSLNLKQVLTSLGIKDLFHEVFADLSKMAAGNKLYMSDAIHKAFIVVNEEGSEAAAASAIFSGYEPRAGSSIPHITFRVDRPFIFVIKDKSTNSALFIGKFEGR